MATSSDGAACIAAVLLTLSLAALLGAIVSAGITYALNRRRVRDVGRLESVLARERHMRRMAEAEEVAARACAEAARERGRAAEAAAREKGEAAEAAALALAAAAREEITALAELPQKRIEQLTKRRVIVHMASSSIEGTLWAVYADSIVLRNALFYLDDLNHTNLDGDQVIPFERIGWIQELSAAPVRIAESLASASD